MCALSRGYWTGKALLVEGIVCVGRGMEVGKRRACFRNSGLVGTPAV